MTIPATLILETKASFKGFAPSWQKDNYYGEVVFSTGMTGYVESLTDPSYKEQILTFTYPLIGNYGVSNPKTYESKKIHATGVVIANLSPGYYHHAAEKSFIDWLKEQNVPLIFGIDTRALTKHLRTRGSSLGVIQCSKKLLHPFHDPNDEDLVQKVSTQKCESYGSGKKTVIVVDCGMKENILRCLRKLSVKLIKVPFNYDYSKEKYDGVFISNGPGNPEKCIQTIDMLKDPLKKKKPIFGICLGCQLLALAIGGKTHKLKFGHRGHNQPCFDYEKNRAILTSQNHGWAIKEDSLPKSWKVFFRNLNDQSIEGIEHKKDPFFAVQFHPESCPGPNDGRYLFQKFAKLLEIE